MLFSRFWIFLLACVAALSVAAMTLARTLYDRDRSADVGQTLSADRKLVDEFLRHDARQRLDDLAGVTLDSQVISLMEARSHVTDDNPVVIGHSVSDRLRQLNQDLGPLRGDLLFAVDPRGVVVGRVGLDDGSVGQNLGGLPIVASALRGNVRDDFWELSGTPYRMAARPVISRGQYYVGAIVHGIAIRQDFVERIGQLVPGASVMFFGPEGLLVAVAPPGDGAGHAPPAPAVLADGLHSAITRSDWLSRGYTDVLLTSGRDGSMVFASLPGMLGAGGGGFALGRALPVLPGDFLLHAARPDLARLPWAILVALALAATAVGFVLVWWEYDSKKRALRVALIGLQRANNDRLDPLALGGFARDLAVVANDGIEEVIKREVVRAGGRRRSVGEIETLLAAQAGAQRSSADEDGTATSVAAAPPKARGALQTQLYDPDEGAHWREVYAQFITRRRECNEPVESLTFDKFAATLQKHKDAVLARTECRAVRFQVVVNAEGRATLKASAVR